MTSRTGSYDDVEDGDEREGDEYGVNKDGTSLCAFRCSLIGGGAVFLPPESYLSANL